MKLQILIGCGVLLASLAGASMADDLPATTVPQILQMQHALRAKLDQPTGEYSRFDATAISEMKAAQDRVFHMLDGVTSLDQLNEGQKVELSNALDEIKAKLLANDGDRVICHIERKTGTHLSERRCESVASRERNAAEAQKYMMDHPDHIQQSGH
jgi:hypothetical protein